MKRILPLLLLGIFISVNAAAQIIINEGSNRNYQAVPDENGDYPDWIELYNAGVTTINLLNYSLTDDPTEPAKWTFPAISMAPGEYRVVFCSGKDRKPTSGFVEVMNTGPFTPVTGWNLHSFTTPFHWDGTSNILINTCSYSSSGYTSNSCFKQTATDFPSTSFAFMDGSTYSCTATYGYRAYLRPDLKLNNHIVGTGTIQNSPTDYPAPYGNWYWGAHHQMLVRASELTAAGLTAGNITSLAFLVASTDPNTHYDYIDISMKLVTYDEAPATFDPVDTHCNQHTNFKISSEGETIYLYSPAQTLVSQLFVNCGDLDNSRGSKPDGSVDTFLFGLATPGATNNASPTFTEYLLAPTFSPAAGIYDAPVEVNIQNPNPDNSSVRYTIDGSDPTSASILYTGTPVALGSSHVLKARAFSSEKLPSTVKIASYLIDIEHITPVISVATDSLNLYGPEGIFDNWPYDWKKSAFIDYFDSTLSYVFSRRAAIQIDGGWGGARANPQHSFRVMMDDGVLGDGPVNYQLIPDRPDRMHYSQFFLRNGSNQYLVLPYKDACIVKTMSSGTMNHNSAWRPVSVYINGHYFGLYELREKYDAEYFETLEGSDKDQTDILSMTAWNNYVLHATEGSVEPFYQADSAFLQLDPYNPAFWDSADQYFDMASYADYIIGESWIGNTDWPWNNIKIYRSDKTNFRWRFCLTDMELGLLPNGWTDCYFDAIAYMIGYDPADMVLGIWKSAMHNDRFRNYFVNRYADLMNTFYKTDRILPMETDMYERTVAEMQKEYARWGDPNNIQGQMLDYYQNHSTFHGQLEQRTDAMRNHIRNDLGLPNMVDVTLDVYPPEAGTIRISTITPGPYPWDGVYYNGIPIQIEAIANDGYNFKHWGHNSLIADTLNPVWLDTLDVYSANFTAYFEAWGVPVQNQHPPTITLYPNPADEVLYVKSIEVSSGSCRYQVLDVSGRVVTEGALPSGSTSYPIDIAGIRAGVYFLRFVFPDGNVRQLRFVKTK